MKTPKFRDGIHEIALYRRRDLVRISSQLDAERVADALLGASSSSDLQRDVDLGLAHDTTRERLVAMLLAGEVLLVREEDARRLDTPRRATLDPRSAPPVEPSRPSVADTTWIAVVVVDRDGRPRPLPATIAELPDGSLVDVVFDHTGRWRHENVPTAGTCTFRVSRVPASHGPRIIETVASEIADRVIVEGQSALLHLATGREHRIVVDAPHRRLEVRFDDGTPIGDATIELGPAGATPSLQGRIPTTGDLGIAGLPPGEPWAARILLAGHVSAGMPADRSATTPTRGALQFRDGRSPQIEVVTDPQVIVLARPILERPTPGWYVCEPGSALAVQGRAMDYRHPLAAIMTALDRLRELPESRLSIVGHAEASEPKADRGLAGARAQVVASLLRNDRAQWVRLATDFGTHLDVTAYLAYLANKRGWDCDPGEPTMEVTEDSTAAVERFQRGYNGRFHGDITEDGICGEDTLGAIFDVLHRELQRWGEKYGLDVSDIRWFETMSVGAPASALSEAVLGDPRVRHGVDLLIFDPAALDLGGHCTASSLYEHAYARLGSIEPADEPDEWEFGTLGIVTDMEIEHSSTDERYRLRATDGSYDLELNVRDHALIRNGGVELLFDRVPIGPTYTLTATSEPGHVSVLFEDEPFHRFHAVASEKAGTLLDPAKTYRPPRNS